MDNTRESISSYLYPDLTEPTDENEVTKATFILDNVDRAFACLAILNDASFYVIATCDGYENLPEEIREKITPEELNEFVELGMVDLENLHHIRDLYWDLFPGAENPLAVSEVYFPRDGNEGKPLPGEGVKFIAL